MRPSLRRMRERTDPNTFGGAYLLGVRGLAVIGHGNATPVGIANAVRLAARGAREGLVEQFAAALASGDAEPGASHVESPPPSPGAVADVRGQL